MQIHVCNIYRDPDLFDVSQHAHVIVRIPNTEIGSQIFSSLRTKASKFIDLIHQVQIGAVPFPAVEDWICASCHDAALPENLPKYPDRIFYESVAIFYAVNRSDESPILFVSLTKIVDEIEIYLARTPKEGLDEVREAVTTVFQSYKKDADAFAKKLASF